MKIEQDIPTPMIETEKEFIALGSAKRLEEAGKIALEAMIKHLTEEGGLTAEDAYKLCSVACDLRISQVVNPQKTARVSIEKSILEY